MSLLEHIPHFSRKEAISFSRDRYGLEVVATPLPSERDQNCLLETESGARYVLKIANALEDRALLEAQNQAMLHLARHGVPCSQVVPTGLGLA